MKTFRQHIKEKVDGVGTTHDGKSVEDGSIGVHNIHLPEILKRVNAFVGSIADREYLIPEAAIQQLRNFMMRIGVQFPKVDLPESGAISLPLSQWGGRFGKDLDTPYDEFVNDDGITDRLPGGLSLEIKTEAVANGSWKVYAEIK